MANISALFIVNPFFHWLLFHFSIESKSPFPLFEYGHWGLIRSFPSLSHYWYRCFGCPLSIANAKQSNVNWEEKREKILSINVTPCPCGTSNHCVWQVTSNVIMKLYDSLSKQDFQQKNLKRYGERALNRNVTFRMSA